MATGWGGRKPPLHAERLAREAALWVRSLMISARVLTAAGVSDCVCSRTPWTTAAGIAAPALAPIRITATGHFASALFLISEALRRDPKLIVAKPRPCPTAIGAKKPTSGAASGLAARFALWCRRPLAANGEHEQRNKGHNRDGEEDCRSKVSHSAVTSQGNHGILLFFCSSNTRRVKRVPVRNTLTSGNLLRRLRAKKGAAARPQLPLLRKRV